MRLRTIVALALIGGYQPAMAQTRADTAGVLLEAARTFESRGDQHAAQAVWRLLLERYSDTQAGDSARARLTIADAPRPGSGRVAMVAWSTVYGAWLGVAVPAMLSADEPAAYGIGLLLGGPAGFMLSNEWARSRQVTSGQANAATFGFLFGTGQGLGWQQALDLGSRTVDCTFDPAFPCSFEEESGTAPFVAMVAGGVSGIIGGAILGRELDPTAGQTSFAAHSAAWGTWLALAFSTGADDGDAVVKAMMLGGDAGLIGGMLGAPRNVTPARVWLTTALGVGGAAAGLGIALLSDLQDGDAAFRTIGVGSAAGLIGGWLLTRNVDYRSRGGDPPPGRMDAALLDFRSGPLFNLPLPQPVRLRVPDGPRGAAWRTGVLLPLLRAEF